MNISNNEDFAVLVSYASMDDGGEWQVTVLLLLFCGDTTEATHYSLVAIIAAEGGNNYHRGRYYNC